MTYKEYEIKVTVIVPVFNVESYLKGFLDSLLKQTVQCFNVIAINDASTDNSGQILEDYSDRFEGRMHIIDNEVNMHLAPSRNIGLDSEKCIGEYVCFLDSDDQMEETYIEKLLNAAETNAADIVMCGFKRIDENSGNVLMNELPLRNISDKNNNISKNDIRLAFFSTFVWNKLFRREVIGNIRFPDMKRCEDVIFFFEILPNADKIICIEDMLYKYRVRKDSLTGRFNENGLQSVWDGFRTFVENNRSDYPAGLWDIVIGQMYVRCGVGAMSRLHLPIKDIKRLEKECLAFFDEVIPEWRRQDVLGLKRCTSRSLKENIFAGTRLLYKLHLFWLFIAVYHRFADVRG